MSAVSAWVNIEDFLQDSLASCCLSYTVSILNDLLKIFKHLWTWNLDMEILDNFLNILDIFNYDIIYGIWSVKKT